MTLNAALTGPELTSLTAIINAHVGFVTNPTPPAGPGEPDGPALLDGTGILDLTQFPPWVEKEFTPTLGQVTFILVTTPTDSKTLTFSVNGVEYGETAEYTVSGVTITWLDVPFTMETTDLVVVRYR